MARRKKDTRQQKSRVDPHFDDDGRGKPRQKSKKTKTHKKRFWVWRLLRWLLKPFPIFVYWGAVFGLWAVIGVAGILAFYATQLPSADTWHVPERPPNIRIVSMDNELIANRGITGGKALRLEEMSPHIAQAVISIEDRRFHAHFGFDPIGFTRAMTRNIMEKRMREGGSTITQQLAKNLFLKPERTFGRKVQELILAVWLETKYSKAEILELYLNRVYFGAGATGVDAASRRYFGKSAKHVTVPEAALLAGLLKAPSKYSPARNPKLAQRRARLVLRAMQEEGYIKAGKIDVTNIKPGEYAKHFRSGPEHFVSDMIVKRVAKILGKPKNDVIVETTVSSFLMTAAHSMLTETLDKNGKKKNVSQGAMVSMSPDGAVRALIGGRDYGKSQFNRVVDAKRQPGSAFKTFVWLKALEDGFDPSTEMIDEPVRFGKWRPENYDKKYRGPVTLGAAFSGSLNTIAAKLITQAGPRNVASVARRMGIDSKLIANGSLALGTSEVSLFELTRSFAPFANGGKKITPYLIRKITGKDGKVLFERKEPNSITAVMPENLADMNQMLARVVSRGTGKKARLKKHQAGGKTGTSQGFRDALFVGHTAHLVTGVWFGNDDNSPTKKLTGGSLPAKVWNEFMELAHSGLTTKPLPGANVFVADLPERLPIPSPRPTQLLADRKVPAANVGEETTASVKNDLQERVESELKKKAKTSILDLILGD